MISSFKKLDLTYSGQDLISQHNAWTKIKGIT